MFVFFDGQEESWSLQEIYGEQMSSVWLQDTSSRMLQEVAEHGSLLEPPQMGIESQDVHASSFFNFCLIKQKRTYENAVV